MAKVELIATGGGHVIAVKRVSRNYHDAVEAGRAVADLEIAVLYDD
jgi:hypothetical protein